jgi:hypothetical protein
MCDLTAISKMKAKEFAAQSNHGYTKVPDFEPHDWVVEAIKDAYRRGAKDERLGVPF